MAPTICSGKKRESRTLINSNIRRNNGQGSHQLNQTLSNIVNYVAKGSLNARVNSSLRIKTHSQSDTSLCSNTAGANLKQHQQQFSFLSDNAVTSSRHSDTENSLDLRLANETLINDSTPTYSANTNSTSSLSSLTTEALTTQSERTLPSSSPYEARRFRRYSSINSNSSDNDVTDLFKANRGDKDSTMMKKGENHLHSRNIRKHYYDYKDFESEEEEDEEELRNYSTSYGSSSDMDTDESNSMISVDAEKSVNFKRDNHLLWRDKFLVKQQQPQIDDNCSNNTDGNSKRLAGISSTDGLLSIAIKTIKLVKRNQLLQQRLTQLQMETSEFIESVLANPENRHFRENMKQLKRKEINNV